MATGERKKFTIDNRKAAATVELAFVLPLLAAIVFGAIQACNTIHLKQALVSATYEGTRVVAKPSATIAETRNAVAAILDARGVVGYQVTITPNTELNPRPDGRQIRITVSAPTDRNVVGPKFFNYTNRMRVTAIAAR